VHDQGIEELAGRRVGNLQLRRARSVDPEQRVPARLIEQMLAPATELPLDPVSGVLAHAARRGANHVWGRHVPASLGRARSC
jgi:hypothetical protein